MFPRFVSVLALVATFTTTAVSQSTNVTISRDVRLFATMAALNAAGFNIEFGSQYHPVREAVRKYSADVDPDLIARLKAYYTARKGDQTDESQLAKYISLAVNLSDPPDFKPVTREENLPPDARAVVGFAPLIAEFYDKAHIGRHWLELRSEYDHAIAQIAPSLRELIVRTDAYMRVPLGTNAPLSLSIYLELAAPVNTVNVRSNQDSYFVIIGDSTNPKVDDIRHAYLHFQLDGLVTRNLSRFQNASQLLDLVKKAEGVDPEYVSEFRVMVAESLIRAVELRMDKIPGVRAKDAVNSFYRSGLLLTPYFYSVLEGYEKGESSLRDALPEMARNVQLSAEKARFQDTFYKIPAPAKAVVRSEVPEPTPPEPPPNPVADLLSQAQTAFNAGELNKAESAFERVLSDFDRDNGPAEYGLGLIASKKGDSDEAKQYFDRVIRHTSVEPRMKVWSYIYRARIFDLECSRDRAIEYYEQAVKVGDNSQNAQAAARDGLEKPYGDACK